MYLYNFSIFYVTVSRNPVITNHLMHIFCVLHSIVATLENVVASVVLMINPFLFLKETLRIQHGAISHSISEQNCYLFIL